MTVSEAIKGVVVRAEELLIEAEADLLAGHRDSALTNLYEAHDCIKDAIEAMTPGHTVTGRSGQPAVAPANQ